MNRERAKELLPIITAFAEGKAIQVRIPENDGGWTTSDWTDADAPDFIEIADYRIKPEPREWWVFPHTTVDLNGLHTEPYIARDTLPPGVSGYGWIKVREVLE